ncbi:hypothetical protein [Exiguobacterium oxidotolerans]|uniref:Uncharacterized protein n=1 Tax=Exiguobacterium oxidotolerans TaxID=223958 RepID=A0A653I982_9BACL|nr:hypothetical protein [Exiguobacterium oxidotolerans]VWX35686.1 hypothetical protein EXIGUO9Y_260091 [Exiguobacterium oxidotolerans]
MEKPNFDLIKVSELLDWGYEKATKGGMGIESAYTHLLKNTVKNMGLKEASTN